VERHQKEFKIPAELIADLLMERGEMVWAMKMMAKMPPKKKDEQYLLLQRIGKYKEVIDLAADRKDVEALEEIHETLLDPTLLAYCNEKMSLLKRK
jgi:Zn-dependent peptidase ImmA (M78 family)